MVKTLLSLFALALVAACASRAPVTPSPVVVVPAQPAPPAVVTTPPPAIVVQQQAPQVIAAPPLRPGYGRIESIAPATPPTAAAGGQTLRRFGIRMDDGTLQFVDTTASGYLVGDRIELTSEGWIRKA